MRTANRQEKANVKISRQVKGSTEIAREIGVHVDRCMIIFRQARSVVLICTNNEYVV